MSSIHKLPSKFTTATFVLLRCHVSVSNYNWLLKVNFALLTHFASSMLLCILNPNKIIQQLHFVYFACCHAALHPKPQQNHQTAAFCVSCMLPCCFCILIPQQNHETNMPNWRSRRLPKTMKKACRLKPSKSLSLQALRLQAPQPSMRVYPLRLATSRNLVISTFPSNAIWPWCSSGVELNNITCQ